MKKSINEFHRPPIRAGALINNYFSQNQFDFLKSDRCVKISCLCITEKTRIIPGNIHLCGKFSRARFKEIFEMIIGNILQFLLRRSRCTFTVIQMPNIIVVPSLIGKGMKLFCILIPHLNPQSSAFKPPSHFLIQ